MGHGFHGKQLNSQKVVILSIFSCSTCLSIVKTPVYWSSFCWNLLGCLHRPFLVKLGGDWLLVFYHIKCPFNKITWSKLTKRKKSAKKNHAFVPLFCPEKKKGGLWYLLMLSQEMLISRVWLVHGDKASWREMNATEWYPPVMLVHSFWCIVSIHFRY